jgi:hypothetical protein
MNELQEKIGILNPDWLMSTCEKLGLIGLAIAWKSQTPGQAQEFAKEISSFAPVAIQNSFRIETTITAIKAKASVFKESALSKIKITMGRLLGS